MGKNEEPLLRLLRGCHLLSALSREVLEKGYLRQAGYRDVSFVQLNLLKYLDSPQPRTIGDVMRFMGVSFPAASKAVGRLKNKKLVRAGPHPGDRRAQIIRLTPSGRRVVSRYEKIKFARVRRLLRRKRKAEVNRWCRALEEISTLLIREQVFPPDLCIQCGAYYSDRCLVGNRECRVRKA